MISCRHDIDGWSAKLSNLLNTITMKHNQTKPSKRKHTKPGLRFWLIELKFITSTVWRNSNRDKIEQILFKFIKPNYNSIKTKWTGIRGKPKWSQINQVINTCHLVTGHMIDRRPFIRRLLGQKDIFIICASSCGFCWRVMTASSWIVLGPCLLMWHCP